MAFGDPLEDPFEALWASVSAIFWEKWVEPGSFDGKEGNVLFHLDSSLSLGPTALADIIPAFYKSESLGSKCMLSTSLSLFPSSSTSRLSTSSPAGVVLSALDGVGRLMDSVSSINGSCPNPLAAWIVVKALLAVHSEELLLFKWGLDGVRRALALTPAAEAEGGLLKLEELELAEREDVEALEELLPLLLPRSAE